MADLIYTTGPDDLRRQLRQLDDGAIMANIMIFNGALHALNHLLANGVSAERAERMREDCERSKLIVEQIAAERGMDIQVNHQR